MHRFPCMDMGTPIPIIVALLALSIALFVAGLLLRRKALLTSRGACLAWAILSVLPLFGTGLILFTRDQVNLSTGKVPVREDPNLAR
ncbi:hypothetical protein [Sphingobium sp.]|uniref:hypothetical protein n=1 Tax=Sphingobium sp. TaxID=1912891 RepID=UPI002B6DE50D|nr:hypothetical protein [Sphingobium sp.]HUD95327.1 hypothetical protein [Sphingobium sp.]